MNDGQTEPVMSATGKEKTDIIQNGNPPVYQGDFSIGILYNERIPP